MGLMGIHDPDALCHFSGITHHPWCWKEGQNEGTMVNHLQMVCYRLGLVCNQCHDCPSTMVETLHHTAGRSVTNLRRKILMISFVCIITRGNRTISAGDPNKGVKTEWSTLGCPIGNTPAHHYSQKEDQQRRDHPPICTSCHLSCSIRLGGLLIPLRMKFKVVNENN